MKTLAQVLLQALEALSTVDEPGLDTAECADLTNDTWGALGAASPAERAALSEAATTRLRELLRPPDEHGYSPRGLVTDEQGKLLESIADGSAFDEPDDDDDDD
jgi:hypothetical protein